LFWLVCAGADPDEAVMKSLPLLVAVSFGFALLAAPAAQAFTIENQDSTGDAPQNFLDLGKPAADPDQHGSRFSSGGQTKLQSGNATFEFGSRPSFGQRYNPSNLFDPLGSPDHPR
jgi:hypothetical protein